MRETKMGMLIITFDVVVFDFNAACLQENDAMRKIDRSSKIPDVLLSEQAREGKKRIFTYLRQSEKYRSQRRDNLDESFFYSRELKNALEKEFGGECAFCESPLHNESAILHFRPLKFAEEDDRAFREYYLWLAYEWRNIFISCHECNKRKGNKFPVIGARANYLASYKETCASEISLLLDPSIDDPKKHLNFMVDGSVIGMTKKGNETIGVFSLNRMNLMTKRKHAIDKFLYLLGTSANAELIEDTYDYLFNLDFPGVIESIARDIAFEWRELGGPTIRYSKNFLRNLFKKVVIATPQQHHALKRAINYYSSRDQYNLLKNPERNIAYALTDNSHSSKNFRTGNVRSIHVHNFKAIKSFNITLPEARENRPGTTCLMFLGENSTGKTSLLSAISLALLGSEDAKKLNQHFPELVRSHDASRLDQLDQEEIKISLVLDMEDNICGFNYDPENDILEESSGIPLVLAYGPRRFFNPKKANYAPGVESRVKTLFEPLATIPDPTRWLNKLNGHKFDTVAATLRIILSLNDDDEIIRDRNQLAVRANGRVTPIHALSEGYKSLFIMSVDIMRELMSRWPDIELAQAVVLIDEIETHLHPRWKMRIMSSLRRAFPNVQFIATTHDPLCLRGMNNGEVVVLDRDAEANIYAIEDLPDIHGMTVEQLLTSDYFGLSSTADPDIEFSLASLAVDIVEKDRNNVYQARLSERSREKLSRVTLGDTVSEQIISEAIRQYLIERESRTGDPRTALRRNVVNTVIDALRKARK